MEALRSGGNRLPAILRRLNELGFLPKPDCGVTIRTSIFPWGTVLEHFPPGFRGPATLLTRDFEVLHWECPPTLEELDQAFYEYEARDADVCGDPNHDGQVSATDALMALLASVSGGDFRPAQCDTDRSGDIAATDALRIRQAGFVLPPRTGLLRCPAPCASRS